MKTIHRIIQGLALLALATLNLQPSPCFAQGTAITYQGRLGSGGTAVTGLYDFSFALYDAASGGIQQGVTFTTNAVPVTNGYFMVALDFGGVFDGNARWLDIAVKTNAAGSYSPLIPRQPLTPAPYAIMASSASNLLGTLPSAQLTGTIPASQLSGTFTGNVIGSATSATMATTANNFSGLLAGDVTGTQGATFVSTVGGSGAANIHAAEQLANAATSANTPNAIVKRDASGNFTIGTITLNGYLDLPATTASAGIIYAGGSPFIHAYGSQNFFAGAGAGNLTMTGTGENTGVGVGALQNNTSGNDNTANGQQSLHLNTVGWHNTANGSKALYNNTNGCFNTANGSQALYSNTSGDDNTAIGFQALYNNTNGSDNTASGSLALSRNTSGYANTANGEGALMWNTNGSENTASGTRALALNSNGSYNTADGYFALLHNTSGSNNIALGFQSGWNNITGSSNIDIGNPGVVSDNNIIRIGDQQTQTFIAGVINGNGGGLTNLNAPSLTGTIRLAQLPAMVLTNAATAANAVALGNNNTASGWASTVLGYNTAASGTASTALGFYSTASGDVSTALGSGTVASGPVAFAAGSNTLASGFGSVAMGANTKANNDYSTVGGGAHNIASGAGAVVAGGGYDGSTINGNTASGPGSAIGGGTQNIASGSRSTVGGGHNNSATNWYATVPGGAWNIAGGTGSFAAGQAARAKNDGSFVWNDNSGGDFVSTANNQFLIHASGGVGIGTASPAYPLTVQAASGSDVISFGNPAYELGRLGYGTDPNSGLLWLNSSNVTKVSLRANGPSFLTGGNVGIGTISPSYPLTMASGAYCSAAGVWTSVSDRNVKENFTSVAPTEVLAKVVALSITQWKYKIEPNGIKHIGPVAQDFHAAFGLGDSDKAIGTVDESGVALAAIQGLNQKLDAKDAEIQDLKARLEKLEQILEARNGGGK